MRLCLLFLYLILLPLVDNHTYSANVHKLTSSLHTSYDIVSLERRKLAIDKMFKASSKLNSNKLLVFVKVSGSAKIRRVFNENWPDNVNYTYNFLKDQSDHIIEIISSPYSESGDWDIEYVHYFDENGKTFAFERRTGFFNSECTEEAAHETITIYYDTRFKQTKKVYKLTDSHNRDLSKSECTLTYDFKDFKVYSNLNDCIKNYHLNQSKINYLSFLKGQG